MKRFLKSTNALVILSLLCLFPKNGTSQGSAPRTGNSITEIKRGGYRKPARENDTVLDFENAYVIPGLWNMHTHLSALLPDPNNIQVNESMASAAIRAGLNAMDGLRHGFTALRSVGERDYLDVAWRDAFAQGFFIGPRIFASGEADSPTAGHRGYIAHGADGVAEIRKAVRTSRMAST